MDILQLKLVLVVFLMNLVAACAPTAANSPIPVPTIAIASATGTRTRAFAPTTQGEKNSERYQARVRGALAGMKWVNFTESEKAGLADAIINTYTTIEPDQETLPVPLGFEVYVPLVRQYMTSESIVEALASVKTIENNVEPERNAYGRQGWVGIGRGYFQMVTSPEYQAAIIEKESFVSLITIKHPMPNFNCDGPTSVRIKLLSSYFQTYEIESQTLAGMFKLAFGGDASVNLAHIMDVEAHPENWWHDPCPQ